MSFVHGAERPERAARLRAGLVRRSSRRFAPEGGACNWPETPISHTLQRMWRTRVLFPFAVLAVLGAGAPPPGATRQGPVTSVTRVHVKKSARTMSLFAGDTLVASYAVAVGRGGAGPKKKEGDNVTPVGRYRVLRHLPSHLRIFLQLDYPNATDRARFEELKQKGDLPKTATIGGDIGIHGEPPEAKPFRKVEYQSHGCVVLEDAEIDQVARLVPDGAAVDIED